LPDARRQRRHLRGHIAIVHAGGGASSTRACEATAARRIARLGSFRFHESMRKHDARSRSDETRPQLRRLCVFCGSNFGARHVFADAARVLARALATRGIGLVYGGGSVGLMGILADAVLAAEGEVIGIIPRAMATKEIAHQGLSDLRVVESMHERKALMAELADGFVALPGGFGTLEELLEMITWAQLGIHRKPIGILNVAAYFDPLLELIDGGIHEQFIRAEYRDLFVVADDADVVLERLAAHRPPPPVLKWIGLDES
jgi:hypothetical protein